MDTASTILVAIKPLHYQGHQRLQERWAVLVDELRDCLRERGFEDGDSHETLLLFTFNHPQTAVSTLSHFISKTRRDLGWSEDAPPLPLQIILHLCPLTAKSPVPYRNPEAGVWELLSCELIHISKALRSAWERLMIQTNQPAVTFSDEGEGLIGLHFAQDDMLTSEPLLLPCRTLAAEGTRPPCFYCGMRTHPPSLCPSKSLSMEHEALSLVGYLPFGQLAHAYQAVFSKSEALSKILANGVTPAQIRKNAELLILVAFLDINRVYQLRFLWNLTFSRYSKWQNVWKAEPLPADNKNLQMGFDCLRVGKGSQAEEFLQQECHAKSPRRFAAAVGLAFVALETRGLAEMRNFLELAKATATQAKESMYIALLLARCYDLSGEGKKARAVIANLLTEQGDCLEALYRKIQLVATDKGGEEACQLLRGLIVSRQRALFMAALMDPALLPLQTKLEDLLASQYDERASHAEDLLSQAQQGINELAFWLEAKDPALVAQQTTLATLQKSFQRRSYNDVLDVEQRANSLLEGNKQLQEAKLNELYDQLKACRLAWQKVDAFWSGYRYQFLFPDVGRHLTPFKQWLHEADLLAKKNEGATYHQALHLLRQMQETLDVLGRQQRKMALVDLVCDVCLRFIKNLAIAEVGGAILANLLLVGLSQLPEGHAFANLGNAPLFQRQILTFTAFLLAPIFALIVTIKGLLQR